MESWLGDTQTPNTQTVSLGSQFTSGDDYKAIWGRLFSTYIHLEPVDLHKNMFTIGRGLDCDVVINEKVFPVNKCQTVSKLHFIITREPDGLAYITDTSKNGTFINGEKIGKGRKNILENDDEISIGLKNLRVYVFKTLHSSENLYLPTELRKKYVVSRLLGTGACGEVKLIFDKVTCKQYAVKKIVKTTCSQKLNHIKNINREISILKSLSHPCVVKMIDFEETPEAVFIILEYLDSGELTNYIQPSNRLTENQVKFIFYQILLAVQYLHSKGVTHRDLKPGNVLLKHAKPNSIVKLADFGLSKIKNDQTMLRTMCGTLCYTAPEVLDRKYTSYDQQVDIWSMGVILFHLLSQELPFIDENKGVLNAMILTACFKFNKESWQGVSEEAKDLVTKMLVVNPADRIKIEEIFDHPWIKEDICTIISVESLLCTEQESTAQDDKENQELEPLPHAKRRKTSIESNDSLLSSSSSNDKDSHIKEISPNNSSCSNSYLKETLV